jgi:hypothetical protein
MNKDLWPADHGLYIRYDPATFVPPPPRPSNPFDSIPPGDLFDAGVTPECYLCWQSERIRDIVRSAMKDHPGLTIADAVEELWWHGGI